MLITGQPRTTPTLSDKIIEEVEQDPARRARLLEIKEQLTAVIGPASDELYELLLDGHADPLRKLVASMMARGAVEKIVNDALSAKADERPPLFP